MPEWEMEDGTLIAYRLLNSARKNIVVRALPDGSLRVNVPPSVGEQRLKEWMRANSPAVYRLWQQAQTAGSAGEFPAEILLHGIVFSCEPVSGISRIAVEDAAHLIRLPAKAGAVSQEYRQMLAKWLYARARRCLPDVLQTHADRLGLYPEAVALSRAKTFWGVCRNKSIRLNWRLIGAPDAVVDYVCVHELCHLQHPNHSSAFWDLVHASTPHTAAAKAWLKSNGRRLFVLG